MKDNTQLTPEEPVVPPKRDRRVLSAYRHGITGQIVLMTQADQIAYQHHCAGYVRSFAPVGDVEVDTVQALADDRWRLKRAAALESAILAAELGEPDEIVSGNDKVDAALAMGRAWLEKGGSLEKLTLYESRIQRRFERNLEILRKLQQQRAADTERVAREYKQLAQAAYAKGEAFDANDFPREALPAGFVFSPTQIEALLTHQFNLDRAWKLLQYPPERAA